MSHELDEIVVAELVEPFGVVTDLGLFGIEDLEDLLLVGLGVGCDLLGRQRLARDVASGGVADERGGVTDEEDDRVTELLEVAQLADQNGVAEVKIGSGGIEARLDPHRLAGCNGLLDTLFESLDGDDLGGTFGDEIELVFNGWKCRHGRFSV